jgi:hypothetical protein
VRPPDPAVCPGPGAMRAAATRLSPATTLASDTHRDGPGGELVAQSWNAQWAATTAMALRSVRLHPWGILY